MAELRPFRGLRPPPSHVQALVAPPYDVVSSAQARALAEGKPSSFLRISRPEVGLPEGTDEHSEAVHAQGAKVLAQFQQQGWLQRDEEAQLYLYRQRQGSHVQTGVVAATSLQEYQAGLILKHELTRSDKEEDRFRHLEALGVHEEPVFLTYRGTPLIDTLVAEGSQALPVYDFETADGVAHSFWKLSPALSEALVQAFRAVSALYIADGHHRSAAAARVHAAREARGMYGAHDVFLAVIFPQSQVQILAYHRAVTDLAGLTPDAFVAQLSQRFEVTRSASAPSTAPGTFGLFLDKCWYQVRAREKADMLDVTLLQSQVLSPLLGIEDPRRDPRMRFVGGFNSAIALESLVTQGSCAAAFLLHPLGVGTMMDVADAGEVLPPKSTWFEPKLLSGLILHPFS